MLGALAAALPAPAQPVVTIITHGYSLDGTKGAWIESMADAILARAGGGSVFRYRQDTGAWQLVGGAPAADQPICLIARWLEDFDKAGPDWGFAEGAADALHAALREPVFVDGAGAPLGFTGALTERTMHFISHSRGTCVNSEITRRLGLDGIAVDQVTTMDPHPVDGTLDEPFFDFDWGDPTPVHWSNVAFADNYWRADGGGFNAFDFDGIPLPDTLDTMLDEGALECCAYGFSHSDVHLWYHGTIDTAPAPCDGEECINSQMRSTWWPEGYTEVGYFHAALGGGSAMRPPIPPGAAPAETPAIYGGSFEMASAAGWLYHGGAVNGQVVESGGATVLRLGAGAGPLARHNRHFLADGAHEVVFSYRIAAPDAGGDDVLAVSLLDAQGQSWAVGSVSLFPDATGWVAGHAIAIPANVPRGRTMRLTFQVESGGALGAVVEIDDIGLTTGLPGDLDGDGSIGTSDLLALLAAWGPCPAPPAACPADLDGNGAVGTGDLLLLLAGWS